MNKTHLCQYIFRKGNDKGRTCGECKGKIASFSDDKGHPNVCCSEHQGKSLSDTNISVQQTGLSSLNYVHPIYLPGTKSDKPYYVYILKLQNDKFYVGKTERRAERIEEHLSGKGSEWTKLYPSTQNNYFFIKSTIYSHMETDLTLYMMKMYNICNVRGGLFSQITLSMKDINMINTIWNEGYKELTDKNKKKLLWESKDRCIKCGSSEHFIRDCNKGKKNKGKKTTES